LIQLVLSECPLLGVKLKSLRYVKMMEMVMKLYEFGPTRSIRARWALQELGVEFEAITINLVEGENRSPGFLSVNPAGKLPVLVDGDVTLTESVAIVLYLAEKYPDKKLLPATLAERAQLNRWLLFTTTELEQPLWRMARHTNLYPQEKRIPDEIAVARDDFLQMVPLIDQHMHDRQFVVGDRVTVGDFVLAYTLDWANEVNLLERLPRLASYMEKMYARPHAPLRIKEAFARLRQ
jgi:glutathione S-transferase